MSLAAVDAVDDAIDATKRFLLPFDLGTWLRLAFVLFFVGGGGGGFGNVQSFTQFGQGDFGDGADAGAGGTAADLPSWLTTDLIVAAILVLVVVGLLFAVVGAVMEFVFTDALIREEIHVRQFFRERFREGLRLFGFRLLVGVAALVVFAVVFGVPFVLLLSGSEAGSVAGALSLVALMIPVFLLFALVFGIVNGFTNVFVVPMVIHTDRGIIASWSRLWGSITANPKEYLAYLFFSVVLTIGVNLLGGFAVLFGAVIVGIPFLVLGVIAWTATAGHLVAAGIVVGLYLLVLLVVSLLVQVPLTSFLRYYAMLVLGDVDPELDPIEGIRADVADDHDAGPEPA